MKLQVSDPNECEMAGYGSSDDDYDLWAGCGKNRRLSNYA